MKATEAMILWTPNREPFDKHPYAGTVAVTTIPEDASLKRHPMSVGACDLDWEETDDAGRVRLMQRYFTQMMHRDNVPEEAITAALSQIDEFKDLRFSSAAPTGDDWL